MPDPKLVASRLAFARELAGLTLGQAARLAGFGWSREMLQFFEYGTAEFGDGVLARMAELYDVNLAWLSGEAPDRIDPDDPRLGDGAGVQIAKLSGDDREKLLRSLAAIHGPPAG